MTKIYVALSNSSANADAPWNVNELTTGFNAVGTVSADLLDDGSVSTGVGLDVDVIFHSQIGSSTFATAAQGEFTQLCLTSSWRANATAGVVALTGVPVGASYTVTTMSQRPTYDSLITVEGSSQVHTSGDAANPAAPNVFAGTVDPDGRIEIQVGPNTGTYGVLNGFILEYTAAASGLTIDVDIPSDINLKWDTTHQLAVTHDGGTTTLDNVTLSAPSGWETVTFTTAPDEASTESFYEHAKTDATIGSYTMQAGDVLAWTTSTGLTLDDQTIPVVNPAATVTGSYKIWSESLVSWSATSTYTITDNGVFSGGGGGDVTAPTLSSVTGAKTGPFSGTASVSTNESGGTLYVYASTNAVESAATVKSGASQAVSNSGSQVAFFSGLASETAYYAHFLHRDAAGNDSAVASTASFTTDAFPVSVGDDELGKRVIPRKIKRKAVKKATSTIIKKVH